MSESCRLERETCDEEPVRRTFAEVRGYIQANLLPGEAWPELRRAIERSLDRLEGRLQARNGVPVVDPVEAGLVPETARSLFESMRLHGCMQVAKSAKLRSDGAAMQLDGAVRLWAGGGCGFALDHEKMALLTKEDALRATLEPLLSASAEELERVARDEDRDVFERDAAQSLIEGGDEARDVYRGVMSSRDRDELKALVDRQDCPKPIRYSAVLRLQVLEEE